MNKLLVAGIVLAGAIGVGAYFHADSLFAEARAIFGSNGGTNTSAKQVEVLSWDLSTGTSTSVLIPQNLTADEYRLSCTGVGTSKTAYTGAGLLAVTVTAATTSTSHSSDTPTSNTLVSNTAYVVNTTFATSSVISTIASSTQAVGGNPGVNQLLKSGSYLTFSTNATNTAVCNIGVTAF